MFDFIRRRLSVRLSLLLSIVVVPALALVALMVIVHEGRVVESLVLKEAKTATLQGAAAYGLILDTAIDTKALTLDEILDPVNEEIQFTGANGEPIHVEDVRYRSKLSTYVKAHGVQQWEDATRAAGNFIFASGMDRRGLVPVTNAFQDLPPRGDATPESAAWDRIHSRGGRQYVKAEQIAAAGFRGNPDSPTLVQSYPRDTGERAWDVAAPIFVKGKHYGGFRVGVSRDRIVQQYHDLTVGLSLLFGTIALVFVGATLWLSWHYVSPLRALAARANAISTGEDPQLLGTRISTTDTTEVGEITRSLNRMRLSLSAAMQRIERKDS